MTKLKETSEVSVHIPVLAMNLWKKLRLLLRLILGDALGRLEVKCRMILCAISGSSLLDGCCAGVTTRPNIDAGIAGHVRDDTVGSPDKWVKLSAQIPWVAFEKRYDELFTGKTGQPACSARMALGALPIKERHRGSDEDVIE